MLALSPFGGSMVSLSEFWSTVTGNFGVGIVVSHRRKSSLTSPSGASRSSSSLRSSLPSHDSARWQFCRQSQPPSVRVRSISRSAIGPCPCPSEMRCRLAPSS